MTNRLRLQKGLVLLAFVIPILLIGLNYSGVDHHNRTLWARITEKVLNTVKEDAVILAPNYDNATFFWYYLIGEGYEKDGLYALPLDFSASADQIKSYLSAGEPLYLEEQRRYVPEGLRVYAVWRIVDDLKAAGLQVDETGSKYVYQVTLPGQE